MITLDGGLEVRHPANTTRPAWWETLNSTAFAASRTFTDEPWLGAVEGSQNGRLWGEGVREMMISDHGILAVRWMKRYLSRLEARDMWRSGGRRKRVMEVWSSWRRVVKRGRWLGSLLEEERGLVSM